MKNIVIDSCVYVSHFGKDGLTPQSKSFFQSLLQTDVQIVLPAIVEAEVLVVLKQNGSKNIGRVSQILSKMKFAAIDREIIRELTISLKTKKPNLKTSDLLVALTTKLNNAVLITWDKQLLKNNICKTLLPTDFKSDTITPSPKT